MNPPPGNSGSDMGALKSAIEELRSDEPAKRVVARERLVAWGQPARAAIDAALTQIDSPSEPVYQELVRVRDWIEYGVDPRKLNSWFREIDLRSIAHGNMFNGMVGALTHHPTFERIAAEGSRIAKYLEKTATDADEAYSMRGAAALLILRLQLTQLAPALIRAFSEEHRQLIRTGADQKAIEEPYRGFLLHSLHSAIQNLLEEPCTEPVFQSLSGMYERGMPVVFYAAPVGEEAIARWNRAENDREKGKRAVWEEEKREAIEHLRRKRFTTKSSLDTFERLLRHGDASQLGPGGKAVELVVGVLNRARHPLIVRDLITLAGAQVPASLLLALPDVVDKHPLAAESVHLFNPYSFMGWGMPSVETREIGDDVLDSVTAGLSHGSERSRSLFVEIASSLPSQEDASDNKSAKTRLAQSVRRIAAEAKALPERVQWLEVLRQLGEVPATTQILDLIQAVFDSGEGTGLATLCEMLGMAKIPAAEHERALRLLFHAAEVYPDKSVAILRALSEVDERKFSFNPALGPEGVRGLIDLQRELTDRPDNPDRPAIAAAITAIRNDLFSKIGGGTIFSVFISSGLAVCIDTAEKFALNDDLYDCLMAKAMVLAVGDPVTTEITDSTSAASDLSSESAYFRLLGPIRYYTSHDTAADAAGRAAEIAIRENLGAGKVFTALATQADVARVARRFEVAERLFQALLPLADGDNDRTRSIRHFQTLLLLEQRRWADALDAALATPEPLGDPANWSEQQRHLALDARLYEAFCRRRLGQISQAAEILNSIGPQYVEIQSLQHYVQVAVEVALLESERSRPDEAAKIFQVSRQLVENRPDEGLIFSHALSSEAVMQMANGNVEQAEALLSQALALQEAGNFRKFEGFDTRAENLFRLGQAQLLQGRIAAAEEPLGHLRTKAAGNELYRAYFARLAADVQVFQGAIPSAIVSLRENLDLLDKPVYPEFKVDLCLDLARLLLLTGKASDAENVVARALAVANEARDPLLAARVQLSQARALEYTRQIGRAASSYAEIINQPIDPAEPGDAWRFAVVTKFLLDMAPDARPEAELTTQVLAYAAEIHDPRIRLELMFRYADFCLSRGAGEAATSVMDRIATEVRSGLPLDLLVEAGMLQGRAEELRGNPNEAINCYRRAVHLVEVMHSSSLESGSLGSGVFVSATTPWEALVRSLVAAGETREALHVVERAKARLFLEQIHWQQSSRQTQSVDIQSYLRVLRRLALIEAGSTGAEAELATLRQELAELQSRIGDQELAAALFPMLGDSGESWARLVEMLRSAASEPNRKPARMVLLEYFTTPDVTYVFGARADWDAPKVERVRQPLEATREYIRVNFSLEKNAADGPGVPTHSKARRVDPAEMSRQFAQFVAPAKLWASEGDYLCLVPHDALHYVPFHALELSGDPLVERNPVLYAPSASLLRYCRSLDRGRRESVLVLGDSDPRRPLPHARAEALQIGQLFGTSPRLGEQATAAVVRESLGDHEHPVDFLHFACHGVFDPTQPLKSGIRLAVDAHSADPDKRLLTAEDLFEFDLPVSLVTLSACESGVSLLRPGDELFGLMRALIYAGAPSIVMTLWAVDEISTAVAMENFYGLLAVGESKVRALQQAQIAVRKLTVADAVEFCRRTIDLLEAAGESRAARSIRRDQAGFLYRARDYSAARQIFENLLDSEQSETGMASLDAAITRCTRLERQSQPVDTSIRIFDHPFYWAPFVLAGDWN
jgi:CHAT domain-containing protein